MFSDYSWGKKLFIRLVAYAFRHHDTHITPSLRYPLHPGLWKRFPTYIFIWLVLTRRWRLMACADGVRSILYYIVQRGLHIATRLSAGHLWTRRLWHTVHSLPKNLLARIGPPFLQSTKLCLCCVARCRYLGFSFLCTNRYVRCVCVYLKKKKERFRYQIRWFSLVYLYTSSTLTSKYLLESSRNSYAGWIRRILCFIWLACELWTLTRKR
jgi:hypothetical protein